MKQIALVAVVSVLTLHLPSPAGAADLGSVLRECGWDRIIGSWADPERPDNGPRVTYRWRYKDRVIEIISREATKETTALMGRNPKSGDIFHLAADDEGGSSIGKWTLEGEEAVLGLLYVTGNAEEGGLEIRHRLKDDDTLIVTIPLPDPLVFTLVRVKAD